jgi:hypothetical protein
VERILTLDDLQAQFEIAREKLSRSRAEILAAAPLPHGFSRDAYGFSYIRAERLGLDAVLEQLDEISWLPMHLDPETEFLLESKTAIKKWLRSDASEQPDSAVFGNDFVHALTRVALTSGWAGPEFRSMAQRIGGLFHDLSCLIGLIYYGVWMAENGILGVPVSDPSDLKRTAKEISDLTRSPEVALYLARHEAAFFEESPPKKRAGPSLRVIENTNWDGASHTPAS